MTQLRADGSRRRSPPKLLSVVAPAFNEEEGLPRFVQEVGAVAVSLADDYEILVVDDGSRDKTREVLVTLRAGEPRLRWLGLSRNFGHQAALVAGLEHARGDVVITMDSDLQHPPSLLPRMVELWRDGYDVVYTTKAGAAAFSLRRRLMMKVGYKILRFVSGLNLTFGQSDFRLLDRAVLDALVAMPERDKFLRGLISWVGFRQTGIEYQVGTRFAGTEKYTFRQLLHLVTTGVFSFTILPLRLFTGFGVTIALLSMLYGVIAVVAGGIALATDNPALSPPGWATLTAAITFLGGIQLIGIGLLGEYIGRIYDEAKRRPTYVIGASSPTEP
ncbi:MAG: glycosyltransferase family 2 protein [Gemmatimonadetes bacterium]|nr:glycosyltransferase family 2 protein [Gemmatimonadota bacterium]